MTIPYFNRMFSGTFTEALQEGGNHHIDRDAELFKILYEFARSYVLNILDPEKLSSLLIEADFYSLSAFNLAVKTRCIKNVFSFLKWTALSPEQHDQLLEHLIKIHFDDKFPQPVDFAMSSYVPFSYSNPGFFKVLSTSTSYTGIQLKFTFDQTHESRGGEKLYVNGTFKFHDPIVDTKQRSEIPKPFTSTQRIRYMRLADGKLFDEPSIHFSTALNLSDWTSLDIFALKGSYEYSFDNTGPEMFLVNVHDYFKHFGKIHLPEPSWIPRNFNISSHWTPSPDVLDFYVDESDRDVPSFTSCKLVLHNPMLIPVSYLCRYLELTELEGQWERQGGENAVGKFLWEDDSMT